MKPEEKKKSGSVIKTPQPGKGLAENGATKMASKDAIENQTADK